MLERFKRVSTLVTRDTPVEVWLTPSIPDWDYIPQAPYRLVRVSRRSDDTYTYEESQSIGSLIVGFSYRNLPRPWEWCSLIDSHNQIVVGWCSDGTSTDWAGCQFGFAVLAAAHPNQVDPAIWESCARERPTAKFIEGSKVYGGTT